MRAHVLRSVLTQSVVAVAVALSLVSCDGGSSITGGDTRYVEAVAGTWQRVNPLYAAANPVDRDLSRLVFSGLTRIGPDGTPGPDLAETWEVFDGGRTYVFHLRDDARWHDGEPFTSRDVAFTIGQVKASDFQGDPALAAAWGAVDVATPDERTVEFRLPEAYAPFLARQTTLGMLPAHLLDGTSPLALFDAPFNSRPVGTGPYRLARLTQDAATLRSTLDYYEGPPAIDTVEVRFYSDYPGAVRALETGDADGLILGESAGSPLVEELRSVGGTSTEFPLRSAYFALYLNNDRVPFDDPEVRQALALSIDREELVAGAMGGLAVASASPVTPDTWAYSAEYDNIAGNPDQAAALLDQAGWALGPNGIRLRAGQEFRFTIRTDDNPVRVAVADAIARQLGEVGVRAEVVSTTYSVLLRDFLRQRRYDAAVVLWDQGPDPDMYAWHSAERGPDGRNLANVEEFVLDALIEEARRSTSPEERADYYQQIQEVWPRYTPSVILAYPQFTYVQDGAVSHDDFGVLSDAAERFATISGWNR